MSSRCICLLSFLFYTPLSNHHDFSLPCPCIYCRPHRISIRITLTIKWLIPAPVPLNSSPSRLFLVQRHSSSDLFGFLLADREQTSLWMLQSLCLFIGQLCPCLRLHIWEAWFRPQIPVPVNLTKHSAVLDLWRRPVHSSVVVRLVWLTNRAGLKSHCFHTSGKLKRWMFQNTYEQFQTCTMWTLSRLVQAWCSEIQESTHTSTAEHK